MKKNDWHENVQEPVVYHAWGHDRLRRPDKTRNLELKREPSGRRSSDAQQLGCVFQDEAAEVSSPEGLRHAETNPMRKTHEGHCSSHQKFETKIIRSDIFAQVNFMSATQRSKIWGAVSRGDRVARARCPRSSVEAGQKCVQIKGSWKSSTFSHLRKISACLHQLWNLRKVSLLWTPERQCTWLAKKTKVKLKWILWRSRVVLR